jgi:2'-5' RNA ligase
MLAVASLLDPENTEKVNQIVSQLDTIFGLRGVQLTPYPHITWLTTDVLHMSDLKDYLSKISAAEEPIKVRTMGIGIFPGEKPVIYIPILRTRDVNRMHARLFQEIGEFSEQTGHFYDPGLWMPHLTLALGDTSSWSLAPVLHYLNQFRFDWDITLDNLCIIKKSGDKFLKEEMYSFPQEVNKEGTPDEAQELNKDGAPDKAQKETKEVTNEAPKEAIPDKQP